MVLNDLWEALSFVCTLQFWRMGVLWTISIIFSYFQLIFNGFLRRKAFSYPRCSLSTTMAAGRSVCIVTGATSGLGAQAAYALSKEGFFVILVGRSSNQLSKVVEDIRMQNESALLKAFEVDMSSFPSIMKFKASLEKWLLDSNLHSSVQLLINNAGILATSSRSTVEGYDQMMATNYIGSFCLTKVLQPLLQNSLIPSRVVNVTSFTHRNADLQVVDKESVCGRMFSKSRRYPYAQIYEFSKLCILLFSYELHQQFNAMENSHQISVIAADPGVVRTRIMREIPKFLSCTAFSVLKLLGLLQSPEIGIHSIIDAALAPPEISGAYFFGGKGRTIDSSTLSYNAALGKKLWATSNDIFMELQQHNNVNGL
ncbi:dehydrogenase/reductase SDR family member on chromosome X [Impatiens glandulifera]|uniref:dehydrogenase/reductase SDR family member on chromosome X n=1 Tax=Impatiens glandulifera TaxID=253017 RepID=UPI001FB08D48|nr:dehydrogenase/reductase SDR family member on chromosome X [Impatiens glandulifera]